MRRIQPIEIPETPAEGGTVTAVQVQKKDPDRCSVFLDGAFAFGLHVNLVAEAGLRKSLHLDGPACRALVEEDRYFKAMKRCLDYLSYRPRTEREIRTRLGELAVPDAMADRVVDRLRDLMYLDDARFALQFAASRARSRGYGPRRIEAELRRKGIDAAVAREAVATECPPDELGEQLGQQLDKALHRYRSESDERKRERKIMAFLIRRGYDASVIRQAMRQHSDD
ncbi:MAG: RecX family transcriptional regulator [Bacteroidetes bacterium]|nr:RecX family transcriptional regulator [Bacteroidota bacterium]MDA0874030.1 RecX family transcriptional regulator [Bacteroidota bacterium]